LTKTAFKNFWPAKNFEVQLFKMHILRFKGIHVKKYFKEISERKQFNVTLVLFQENFMKFQRKTIYADPSLK